MIVRITLVFVLISSLAGAQVPDSLKNSKPSFGFIENKGQVRDQDHKVNGSARFVLSLPGTNVVLRADGFSYDTYVAEIKDKPNKKKRDTLDVREKFDKDVTYKFHRVDVKFIGANPAANVSPSEPSTDLINYYANNDNEVTPMHHYGKVTYKNVYPYIDVEFIARPGSSKPVEYNFIANPGADISQIQLSYKGANKSELLNGNIKLTLAQGTLVESIPASYYQKTKQSVGVRYKNLPGKNGEFLVAFDSDVKKPLQTLVIDPRPDLVWGTYFGTASYNGEQSNDVVADGAGNIYVTGWTQSTSGIATSGSQQSVIGGSYDAFVAKFDTNGSRVWSTYYGGTNTDKGMAISLDPSGNIGLVGSTSSAASIATAGSFQATFGGGSDAFVVKFNSAGIRQWGSYFGAAWNNGVGDEYGRDIGLDASGNVFFVFSCTYATGFATSGAHQTVNGGNDLVIVKFDANGVRQWSTYYGGSGTEDSGGLSVDANGDVVVAGYTQSSQTGIASSGSYQPTNPNGGTSYAGFIVKFNTSGVRQWGTYYGGPTSDIIRALTTDGSSNIYVTGGTSSTTGIATAGAFRTTYNGNSDQFVAKFNPGGVRQWGTYVSDYGAVLGIGVNQSGEVYGAAYTPVSGMATSCAYKTIGPVNSSNNDVYLFKLNSSGTSLVWATYYGGGSRDDWPYGLAVDATNNVYVVGSTWSSDGGIATPGAYQSSWPGSFNSQYNTSFIAKFSEGVLGALPGIAPVSTSVYLSFPATFTAANHQSGNNYSYSYVYQGSTTTVASNTASTNITLPALGSFQVQCATTTATGCTRNDSFTIEVKKAVALCLATLPLGNTGELKLDKFSGAIVFAPTDNCREPILSTCIGGVAQAPVLNNVVSASATTFSDQWPSTFLNLSQPSGLNSFEKNDRGKWRPKSTHTFNKSINYQAAEKNYEAGRFTLSAFNWQYPDVAKGAGWLQVNSVSKYSPDGNPVEERNALNIASTAKFGYKGSVPYLIAQNAEYSSVYYESFENVYSSTQLEEGVSLTGGTRTNSAFHSGANSLSLSGQFTSATLTVNDQIRQKGLQARFWAKGDVSATAINVTATAGTVAAFKLIARSGEWALLESTITGISAATSQIAISISKIGGTGTWIDDMRVQPIDAEMTCYVYDIRTLQLLAVLDDQHFGMFYQYSAEGKLIRKMVETEKGLKTIQETQYNMPTINKTSPLGE